MKQFIFQFLFGALCLSLVTRCSKTNSPSGAAQETAAVASLDQTVPENVVQRLFDAAKSDDPNLLQGLCDPEKENDGDTDCLCALADGYEPHKCPQDSHNRISWDDFKLNFAKGSLSGKAVIEGNAAEVEFMFGENGLRKESMTLANRGGKWYLIGF